MSAPIKVLSYDQTNAPQLSGEVNKLDAIINACLDTGIILKIYQVSQYQAMSQPLLLLLHTDTINMIL